MDTLRIKLRCLLEDYKNFLNQKGLTVKSKKRFAAMAQRLLFYLQEKGINDISFMTQADCQDFLYTFQHLKPSSYNIYISYIKNFLCYLEDKHDVRHIVLQKKKEESKLPNYLPLEVLHQLCTPTEEERNRLLNDVRLARDHAIVEVFASTGLRSCELRSLKIGDLSPDLRICRVATAKKGNARLAFLGIPAAFALRNYLRLSGVNLRKHKDNYLFPGKKPNYPLAYEMVRHIVVKLAQNRIGTPINPHALRHTFATEMMRNCGCIRSVQLLMGHVSISNTVRYCHLNLTDALKAVEKFHPHGQTASSNRDIDKQG